MNPEDDVQGLVQRAQQGDEAAFGELVQAFNTRLYGVLLKIVRNPEDARDLGQLTWVKVWNKLDTFKGDAAFFSWLYRIGTFTALDHLRKKKRKAEVEYLDEMENSAPPERGKPAGAITAPDEALAASEVKGAFEAALDRLSDVHRTVLVLREVEGQSYEEIAGIMKCRKGTVMSRLFHARKTMQEYLKEVR